MDDEKPKHAKITDYTPQKDGSTIIDTKSYHEQLSSHRQDREYKHKTDGKNFIADVIQCTSLIKEGKTTKLCIEIEADSYTRQPHLITYRYTIMHENYGRRISTH